MLKRTGTAGLPTFEFQHTQLSKLYIEAKDNVKFLSTLERYFKNLIFGSLSLMIETIPSLMNGLRMVWIISRYYNTDERMVPLMERIANELADRIELEIDIKNIFRKPPETTKLVLSQALEILRGWMEQYYDVRKKIEDSGSDHRWEFEKRRLFDRTSYMANICENILEVTNVLEEFRKFLGPELKEVTGDGEGIETLSGKVDNLIQQFEIVPFDIYDKKYKSSWDKVMDSFREQVLAIETATNTFINSSFKKLRSAEGAFHLLRNFQNIQSRESINNTMMKKFDDILLQYSKEVENTKNIFYSKRHTPPVNKNYPPVSGAITWAASLFHSIKRPILRFKGMAGLLETQTGIMIKGQYLSLAKEIDDYCLKLYKKWEDEVKLVATEHLKQPILTTLNKGKEKRKVQIEGEFTMPQPPYAVNFSNELKTLVKECKYLDMMGFDLPETALNVTLQETKHHQYVEALQAMLNNYHESLSSYTDIERYLLEGQLEKLNKVLKRGFYPLYWNSLHVNTFVDDANRAIIDFKGLLTNVHKFSNHIEEAIISIENTSLISDSDYPANKTLDISEFYDIFERNRNERINNLQVRYEQISGQLIKIEELVMNTNSGACPIMCPYYLYWEKRLLNAITAMVVRSMSSFQSLLQLNVNTLNKKQPIIEIVASMAPPEIALNVTISDVYKFLRKCVKHIVESSKSFMRWMDKSCLQCQPIIRPDDDPFFYSFYDDLSKNQYIINMMLEANKAILTVFNQTRKYLDSWKRFDIVNRNKLWEQKKKSQAEKLNELHNGIVYFYSNLSSCDNAEKTILIFQPLIRDISFFRVDCTEVAYSYKREINRIKLEFGEVMHTIVKDKVANLEKECEAYIDDLNTQCSELEDLKFVLNVIQEVYNKNMEMSLRIDEILEWYRILNLYEIELVNEEIVRYQELKQKWQNVMNYAKTINIRLKSIKDKFRNVTVVDVTGFTTEINTFHDNFFNNGPLTEQISLESGLKMMDEYKQ